MEPAPARLSYLQRYDSEPEATKLPLVRQFMAEDPLGFFKELRASRPVLVMPECTLVALFDDVIEMLNMPKVFTVALYEPKMANGYLMSHDDDALHFEDNLVRRQLRNPGAKRFDGPLELGLAHRVKGIDMFIGDELSQFVEVFDPLLFG